MTASFDEAALRHWLVDYLVTNIGCSPDDVNPDASMHDLGVGSRDAVVLSGELSELMGRPVSPVEFWQHPSINGLARFLSGSEPESDVPVPDQNQRFGDEPIAIIGMGCRFPGDISDPEAFWQFLADGRSAVTEVPPERWSPFDDGSPEVAAALARTTRWGSFLSDIDGFDADFFDIVPREAAKMDPQQRLLLEVAWEALEHAGTPPSSLRHSQTGVFVGASTPDYGYLASSDLPSVDAWNNVGAALSIIANRLSYLLDLRGPSMTVDTACSSSLVAVHLACQSLRAGDSNLAIAAGVNLLLSPAIFHGFDQAGALSTSGGCHAFDASADGFVRGEGCGVTVLKRLSDAVRDGDRVLAVIRGSAVNQDGRSNGLMAPNPAAQMAVLRLAYTNAGLRPDEVDYVETHGTGTLLGDPIEARALGTVLGRGRAQSAPLLIGAVKTNLGHLESAAGVAGFMKAVLALQRAQVPANMGFETPNPHIPFDKLRLKVVAEETDWPSTGRPRRAGVSSFGFGGTNAHIVLEQAPEPVAAQHEPEFEPPVTTIVVSGKSAERIASAAGSLAGWMEGNGAGVELTEVAHTLNHHRDGYPTFATVCARDRAQAVAGLQALASGTAAEGVVGPHDGPCGPGTVFVYSGQGSQWTGMARQLLIDEPAFAAAIDELEPAFVAEVGFSLHQVIAGTQPVSPNGEVSLNGSDRPAPSSRRAAARMAARAGVRAARDNELRGDARVQPVLMGLQLALTKLWRSYGVEPDAVIGHSMGEVAAAVVAGALTVNEGLRVIAIRSQLMSRLAGQGAVALLGLDADETAALIADHPQVTLAVYSSPRQTVIAGPPAEVDAVMATVREQNRFANRVNMEVASHNPIMDPILPELRAALADLNHRTPAIPMITTVYDDPSVTPVFDADYWAANVRNAVRFTQAVTFAADDHHTFIEISPHPMMSQSIGETLADRHHHTIATLRRDTDDTRTFHTNLNATHTGRPPATPHPPEPHVKLPTTTWHRSRHWVNVRRALSAARSTETVGYAAPGAGEAFPPTWYHAMAWPERALPAAESASGGRWLVIGAAALAAEITRGAGADARVTAVPTALLDADGDPAALAQALAGVDRVLYAPDVAAADTDPAAGYRLFNAGRRLAATLAATPSPARMFLLTRNAQPLEEGDRANPGHAVLWGLGRTLALEHPEIWGAVIDLDESVPAQVAGRYVLAEAGGDGEDQVVYRAGARRVPRLRPAAAPAAPATRLDKDACYLVVGATGNIGPYLIRQLADMGAATIVAVSRNPGSRLDEVANSLPEGSSLVTVAADAADEAAMTALFDRFGADLPPLGGIFLAAFGGGPVTLRDMTDDDVTAMFRPKLDVLSVLHTLSLGQPLTHFVLFSSISGLLGSRWLAHYTATTTFLDTFAYARRAAGLPCTAINWGLWKSLSDTQSDEEVRVTLESGLEPMPDDVAIRALGTVAGPGSPAGATIVAADWNRLATAYHTRTALRIVEDLLPLADAGEITPGASTEFLDALRECEPEGRRDLLTDRVVTLVAAAMGLDSPQSLDTSVGFFQLGMDSLMSVTLQRSLSASIGTSLPASVVFDYPSVDALVGYVATTLPDLIEAAGEESVDDYDNLSEVELLQQLSERLG